ncbi:MAG: NUDIX domain-containing protein [Bacilli bacterium]
MKYKIFGEREEKDYRTRDGSYLLSFNDNFLFPVILNKDGCYLIGGGIENNETPLETLSREVVEEIGAHINDHPAFICHNTSYYDLEGIDFCSNNYFYYAKVLDVFKASEEYNVLHWFTIEETLNQLTLDHQRWAVVCFYEDFLSFENSNDKLIDSYKFIKGLEHNNLEELRKIPKSDFHNHAPYGGNPDTFKSITGYEINKTEIKFKSIVEMNQWCDENISRRFDNKEGFLKRVNSAFLQASLDGVTKLCLNFGVCAIKYFDSESNMIECIEQVKKDSFYEGEFLPELCLDRHKYSEEYVKTFKNLVKTNYFYSLDLTGDEELPIDWIVPLYEYARKHGLVLKAHIGEFSDANAIVNLIEQLNLQEVQHGIHVVESIKALEYAKSNKIVFNIAPTSNLRLCRVDDLKNHPIKKICDYGLNVTINTDDNFIFNTTINNEYLQLYQSGTLSAERLNQIRLFGLNHKR